MKTFDSEITIACVLKSGGCFESEYVTKLKGMIDRNIRTSYNFVTMTDLPHFDKSCIPLDHNLTGWWSKLELFKLKGPILYFDLDTLIMSDITSMAEEVSMMDEGEFRMLTPFNPARKKAGQWASGVMAWHGDYRFLLDKFQIRGREKAWDQVHIFTTLQRNGINIKAINDYANIYSYKRHCVNRIPSDAQIICFHGINKPHIMRHIPIVQDNWK